MNLNLKVYSLMSKIKNIIVKDEVIMEYIKLYSTLN